MDRGLDPRLQRIIENASSYVPQQQQARNFEYLPRTVEQYYTTGPQQSYDQPAAFSPYGHAHFERPPNREPNGRLSLPPRSFLAQPPQSLVQAQTISNVDNHFRFTANLRQGAPISQMQPPRQNQMQSVDTFGQISNAMLMQRAMPVQQSVSLQAPPNIAEQDVNYFRGSSNNRLDQLQAKKQQPSPPFNLSGFVCSPEAEQAGHGSSPNGQASSPTARISLRRTASRPTPTSLYGQNDIASVQEMEDPFEEEMLVPKEVAYQVQNVSRISTTIVPSNATPRSQIQNYNQIQTQQSQTQQSQSHHEIQSHYQSQSHQSLSRQSQNQIPNHNQIQSQAQQYSERGSKPLLLKRVKPMAHGIELVSMHQLPDRFRHVFPYEPFNAVQSKCFAPIYRTNDNVVVSAPTGSGKTAILELAICKLVEGHQSGMFKIVYLAPIKSLCSERLRDWTRKFAHLSLPCAELTGDTSQAEMARVKNASIIVTTPEKWDSITRKWTDHAKLVQMVKLFLIDEVHILKDPRGATLEAIVSRMKKMSADVRFVALSATIPNSHDVAMWLGKDHTNQHLPAHRETFGEDFRPVKLQKHVHGFDGMMNDFAFEKVLDSKITGLIQKYTHKKPILVFCYTRKSCEQTAALLAKWFTLQSSADRPWPVPTKIMNVGSRDLRDLMVCGVAYHHAGLDVGDRHAVETSFLKGDISVICCTSTLAVGVNLPCHLVFLKGTVGYQDGKLAEYSDLEVMQMLGRAGRPQFDDSAVAVIMTRAQHQERYKKMISGQDTLESTLHLNFIELLNSEISLGTVKTVYDAKKWLNGTFLAVRMRENPKYYKIDGVGDEGDTEQRLEKACERDIKLLQEFELVTDKDQFTTTEYGEAMSRYMIRFDTMKLLLSVPPKANEEQILGIVCQATEFKDLKMKPAERTVLRNYFNKSPFIKFPIKEAVSTTAHKVSLMIQIQLGGVEHPNDKEFNMIKRQFLVDKPVIFERVQRLVRCVIDCKLMDDDAVAVRHALDLARSLSAEFWEFSNLQLRQIPQIGPAAIRKLVSAEISSIEKLDEKDGQSIERILSKNPPFGNKIKDCLAAFPRLDINAEIMGKAPFKQGAKPIVYVKAVLRYRGVKTPIWEGKKPSLSFMAETSEGRIAHFWRSNISKLDKGLELKFNVTLANPVELIKCWVACEEIVGTVRSTTLSPDIQASHFPPNSALPSKSKVTDTIEVSHPVMAPTLKTGPDFDEFGDNDFRDDDLAAVVQSIEKDDSHYGSEDFADIDEIDIMVPIEKPQHANQSKKNRPEPPKMSNGKFACQHTCRDGATLKNGKMCKHKCCHEGLEKPPTRKRKPSITSDVPEESANKKTASTKNPMIEFKSNKQRATELNNVEVVDLADRLSPVRYENVVPRDYKKLHALHNSVQGGRDSSIRVLPKSKQTYSRASGSQQDTPDREDNKGLFRFDEVSSDGEFPSLSEVTGEVDHETPSDRSNRRRNTPTQPDVDDTFEDESLDAGMMELDNPVPPHVESPKMSSSFRKGVFDFDAYATIHFDERDLIDDEYEDRTSSSAKESPNTNHTERSPEKLEVLPDPSFFDEAFEPDANHRRDLVKAEEARAAGKSDVPAWVNEMDPSLINFFGDSVEYLD